MKSNQTGINESMKYGAWWHFSPDDPTRETIINAQLLMITKYHPEIVFEWISTVLGSPDLKAMLGQAESNLEEQGVSLDREAALQHPLIQELGIDKKERRKGIQVVDG